MRLLHTTTRKLHVFFSNIPKYAILSHTWQKEEISLQELEADSNKDKAGWRKVIKFCELASSEGYTFAWIDTCCIDKTSSAELSEAINSMFQWYQSAALCYAYLEDVDHTRLGTAFLGSSVDEPFWFKRGWTLQELIAPSDVVFFSADWKILGTRISLCGELSCITGITVDILLNPQLLSTTSVARRMSWAANRKTTRAEDIAYCLMGIFDVNMPLLYGEGSSKAFIRLQEEIIKKTEDQSLFAWQYPTNASEEDDKDHSENEGIFAIHPITFAKSSDIVPHRRKHAPYKVTYRGLEIEIPIEEGLQNGEKNPSSITGVLSCHFETNLSYSIGIALDRASDRYYRKKGSALVFLQHEKADSATLGIVHIHMWGKRPTQAMNSRYCHLRGFPSEIHFSEGIAVEAVVTKATIRGNVSWSPGDLVSQWSSFDKYVVLSAASQGHFVVLDFTISPDLGQEWGELDGFTVVARLFSHDFRVMKVVPWTHNERKTLNHLQSTLNKHHSTTAFARGSLNVRSGNLQVQLEKNNRWDLETYFVDINYHPSHHLAPADMVFNRTLDVRLVEADG
jgi:hypothetical protein